MWDSVSTAPPDHFIVLPRARHGNGWRVSTCQDLGFAETGCAPEQYVAFKSHLVAALGDQDGAAAYVSGVEVVDGRLEVVESVFRGVQRDGAAGGQRHQVAQVVVRADKIADEVDLGGDDVDRGDIDVFAIAHDVIVAVPVKHPH